MLQWTFVFLIASPEGVSLGYLPRGGFLVHEMWAPSVLEIVLQSGFALLLQSVTPHLHQHLILFDLLIFPVWLMWNASCGFRSHFLGYSGGWASFLVFCGRACFLLYELPLTVIFSCWSICPFWSWVASGCSGFKQDLGSPARDWSQAEVVRLLNSGH